MDVEREGGEADVVTFRGSEVFVSLEPASFSSGEAESPWAARDGTRMHSAAVSGVASLKVTGVIVRGFVAAGVRDIFFRKKKYFFGEEFVWTIILSDFVT